MDTVHTLTVLIDRLAHNSTTDTDAISTVYGIRRVVKGVVPSEILQQNNPSQSKVRHLNTLIKQLRGQIIDLETTNHGLQTSIRHLQSNPIQHDPVDHEVSGYTYEEVMAIIREKFGKQNGGLTLWADYSETLHAADPTSQLLPRSRLQSWRKGGCYPAWAVKQLLAMPVVTRTCHKWSPDDIEFLCRLHLANPRKTDEQLAVECSRRFGVEVNSNSIKSKFNILRKEGRIPMSRPKNKKSS